MEQEIWKPVDEFEGLYEISSLGRVKSLKYGKERIMKPAKDGGGYLQVVLYKNGKGKHFKVHRLVAEAFLPNPEGLPEINHLDENPSNNEVLNIEWCNRLYNNNYGSHNKRATVSRSKSVEASKYPDFREICLTFASTAEAGRNGFNQRHVSSCCRGCYSTYRGNFYKNLYWRYAS